MNNDAQLEDMVNYIKQEVLHYLQDKVKEIKPVGEFEYDLGKEFVVKTRVYEVQLESGKRVFAVEDGFKNIYGQDLPDAETASKVHAYYFASVVGENLNEVAKRLELPERFRTD